MKIQERIKNGEQAKAPQGAHRLGASGEGQIDRRQRRQAWARDDRSARRQASRPAASCRCGCCRPLRQGRPPWLAPPGAPRRLRRRGARRARPPGRARTGGHGRHRLARRPRDHGRPRRVGQGRDPAPRPPGAGLQALPRPVRRRRSRRRRGRYDRYEVALHLYSVTHGHHVRLKTTAREKCRPCPRSRACTRARTGSSARPGPATASSSEGHPEPHPHPHPRRLRGQPMRKDYPTARGTS
jgi:hypothetical protein